MAERLGFIITMAKRAGGHGATTGVLNLSYTLAQWGYRVLMLDMTPQIDLTELSLGDQSPKLTIYDILADGRPLGDAVVPSWHANQFLVPGDDGMSSLDFKLKTVDPSVRFLMLRNWLKQAKVQQDYDFVFIDLDPSMNGTALNALIASTHFINPIEPTAKGMKSILKLRGKLPPEVARYNPGLVYLGSFVMKYRGTQKVHREVLDTLRTKMGELVFGTVVRINTEFEKAESARKPIAIWEGKNVKYAERKGTVDIEALAGELLERLGVEAGDRRHAAGGE